MDENNGNSPHSKKGPIRYFSTCFTKNRKIKNNFWKVRLCSTILWQYGRVMNNEKTTQEVNFIGFFAIYVKQQKES